MCQWQVKLCDPLAKTAISERFRDVFIIFLAKYCNAQNDLCKIFADVGRRESADLSTAVERLANSAK